MSRWDALFGLFVMIAVVPDEWTTHRLNTYYDIRSCYEEAGWFIPRLYGNKEPPSFLIYSTPPPPVKLTCQRIVNPGR
jgi:hypothetical protein